MSETKLDNLLLKYNLARNQRVAITSYQNAPPGSIDIERHALGNPFCFRSTKIIDQGFILKTIILADPTLGMNYNVDASYVAALIDLLLLENNSPIYLWTGEFIRIDTLNDFWTHYRSCTSLLRPELERFKEKEQLNQDNLIVLDNTSLQYIAGKISDTQDELPQTIIAPPSFGDDESIEPRYFNSDTLMLYDESEQQRVLSWHEEHDYPLHLKLGGFSENKFAEFITYVKKYNQIFLYFNELIHSDIEIWLTHITQLPTSQIIGVFLGPKLATRSINMILNLINELPQLQFLSINIPQKYYFYPDPLYPLNLATLDLSQHQQLNYLSFQIVRNKYYENESSLLETNDTRHVLQILPHSLNYLYLPVRCVQSFSVFKDVLTQRLPHLKELGCTDINVHMPPVLPAEEHFILLPRVKIISKGLVFPVKGLEKKQPYSPFAFDMSLIIDSPKMENDFSDCYEQIVDYFEDDITLEKAIEIIDNLISLYHSKELTFVAFQNNDVTLNPSILLLIMSRLPKIQELVINCYSISDHIDLPLKFIHEINEYINRSVHRFELQTLKLSVFYQINNTFMDELFSHINVKHNVLIETIEQESAPIAIKYFKNTRSICYHWNDKAEDCRNHFPNAIITRNYRRECESNRLFLSQAELKTWLLDNWKNNVNLAYSQPGNSLRNDTETVENPTKRLPARQLFRTLQGQALPVHYNRVSVRSVNAPVLIDNRTTTIHPGKMFRYDYNTSSDALIYQATQCFNANRRSDKFIIPILHAQDALYKITSSHPIELSYDSQRKVYLITGLPPYEPVTISYQCHSTSYININNQLQLNSKQIISASKWINQFRPLFYLFHSIQFTPEGIYGLEYLNICPANLLPFLICAYFADFKSGTLLFVNQNSLAHEIDNAILYQKVGACRHRSNLAFKILQALVANGMCTIEANLTNSDVHQFLEFLIGDEWFSVCLGGFNSQIELQNEQQQHTEAISNLSQLEEISIDSFATTYQPIIDLGYPFEDNTEGWEELYAETEQNNWDTIIQEFDPYSCDFIEQSDDFYHDCFFSEVEVRQEVIIQQAQPLENCFLQTYPKLNFTNSEDYREWLEEQLEFKNQGGGHILLVVGSIDQQSDALQRDAYEYITENEGFFASISDFQQIKFAELKVDKNGNKKFCANQLGELITEGRHGDVLWININHYQAATINPLFDHRKKLRDKQIPQEVLLIAVMDESQFQEMSDDFTSRFSSIYKLDTQSFQPKLPQKTEKESTKSCFVFGEPLLSLEHFSGYYTQNKGQLQWHEGWLTQQIKQGIHHITLINAPTDLSEFNLLMHSVQQGHYFSNGESITVTNTLEVIYKKQQYNYPPCTLVSAEHKITIDFVLNKITLTNFLRGTYELLNNGSMIHHQSLDSSNHHGYTVLLSESLSNEEWYSLLCFIQDANLIIRFALAPGVILPNALKVTYLQNNAVITREYSHLFPLDNNITWVESDAMLDLMRNLNPKTEFPPVYLSHDAPLSELVGSIMAQEGQPLRFEDTAFSRAIRQGKSLVLYGNPNSEVRNVLESLLCSQPYLIINGTKQYVTSPLSLYFTPNLHQSIIPAQRITAINPVPINTPGPLLITPHGLEHQLHQEVIPHIKGQRISVISGLPQSGKSYLLHQLDPTEFRIHRGMAHLDAWLLQGGILLIDHCHYATLEEQSLIEQVYHAQDTLFLKGQFYPLTAQHKMILIASGSKPLTNFFVNTPSVHCESFNEELRIDALIKPYWMRLNTPYGTQEYWPVIKNMLNQLQSHSGFSGINQLLMALAYIAELAQHESQLVITEKTDSLKYLCNLSLCLLCPAHASKEMKKEVQKTALALINHLLPEPLEATLTPMQSVMVCNLLLHLRLVEHAKTDSLIAKLLVKGIIIEGSPGIGKTYLTQQLVHAMGYQEVNDSSIHISKGYVLAPTDDLRMCKERLMLAKEKGYLIFFDELNTLAEECSGFSERSLVAQLITALEPNHEEQYGTGFYMVASQNTAATFGNRLSLPKELSLRCITLQPGEFRKQDYHHLSTFLKAEDPELIATKMKSALRQYSKAPNRYKKPTVRSLIGFLSPPKVQQSDNKRKREEYEQEVKCGKTPAKKARH